MNILGLAIAAAIPIVMLALWCEYFRQQVREDSTSDSGDPETISTENLTRIRLAGLMATSLQLVAFLATTEIRQQDPATGIASLWITLSALLMQRWLQIRLERELVATNEAEQVHVVPPSIVWAFAGMAIYLGILAGCVITSAVAVAFFHLSTPAALTVLSAGAIIGYSAALASNFIISPWILRQMLGSEPITDSRVRSTLERWFSESAVTAPEFRVVTSRQIQSTNAWLTGFPRAILGIRPILWLTPAMLKDFEQPHLTGELEAIIKHEAAHMKLQHLARRFFLAWSLSLGVLITLAGALAANVWLRDLPIASVLPILSLTAAAGLFWVSIRSLQRQSKRHELEADRHCVTHFGASARQLISALRRLHATNPNEGADTHPQLDERIRSIEPLLTREERSSAEAEQDRQKAA